MNRTRPAQRAVAGATGPGMAFGAVAGNGSGGARSDARQAAGLSVELASSGAAGVHATCVAFGPARGVLIVGASGSGKSALGLQLMALGAALVADDRTLLTGTAGALFAAAPARLHGMIEARGFGIVRATALARAQLVLVIDMGITETDRLPPARQCSLDGILLPLRHKVEGGHFPAAIQHYILSANRDGS